MCTYCSVCRALLRVSFICKHTGCPRLGGVLVWRLTISTVFRRAAGVEAGCACGEGVLLGRGHVGGPVLEGGGQTHWVTRGKRSVAAG